MGTLSAMPETFVAFARACEAARVPWPLGRSRVPVVNLGYPGGIVLLAALYYGAAHLGFALDFAGPVGAVVWLPVGVGIAFLYLAGVQFWPGVVVGDLLVNNYQALPFGSALGQTSGNLLEVVVATLLLRTLARTPALKGEVGRVCGVLIAIAAGTAISATIGSLSLRAGGVVGPASLPRVWRTWWLGDFSGALLVVPLALAWRRRAGPARRHWSLRELALAIVAVVGTSELAWNSDRPLTYIVFPVLIWTALRLGPRGAAVAVVVASGFAVWATTHYTGPFHSHSLSRGVLEVQLFIAVASVTTQCLAAVVFERELIAKRLWASRARLVKTADDERRRLERNLHDGAQQRLSGLVVRLALAVEAAEEAPAQVRAAVQAARDDAVVAIDELRELAHGKHPVVLTERGLAAAIIDIAKKSPVRTRVSALPASRFTEAVEATAYYVIAEAVANAQKHGRPSEIRLCAKARSGALLIEVEDNGTGGAVVRPRSGLEGLRDRVEAVGGVLDVESRDGQGTLISARIPAPTAVTR